MTQTCLQTDVLIIGAGMIGLTTAIALAQNEISSIVIDCTNIQDQPEDLRTSTINYTCHKMLDVLKIWAHIEKESQPIWDIRVADGQSNCFIHFDHQDIGSHPLGYVVENRFIKKALHDQILEYKNFIDLRTPFEMTDFKADHCHIHATLNDETSIKAQLIIAADGRHSNTRKQAGIDTFSSSYDQTAIVTTVDHQQPHYGVAVEHFKSHGPFAILPLINQRSGLVWVEPKSKASHFLKMDENAFLNELHQRFDGYLGSLSKLGPRFSYDLSFQHAKTYFSHRLVLVGDSAHGIHPIAGQGLNIGFRDVATLSELIIEQARLGLDMGAMSLLKKYESIRRPDNRSMLMATDGLNRLFVQNNPVVKLLRRGGLKWLNTVPMAKKVFMKKACGLSSQNPKLLQGRVI